MTEDKKEWIDWMVKELSTEDKQEWIDWMVKELSTEDKLREDLSDYYDVIQVNSELIYLLSNGLLSKPNYKIEVFKEFLEKYCSTKSEGGETSASPTSKEAIGDEM